MNHVEIPNDSYENIEKVRHRKIIEVIGALFCFGANTWHKQNTVEESRHHLP